MGGVVHFTKRTFDIDRPTINLPVASVSPPTSKNGRNGKKNGKLKLLSAGFQKEVNPPVFHPIFTIIVAPPFFGGWISRLSGLLCLDRKIKLLKKAISSLITFFLPISDPSLANFNHRCTFGSLSFVHRPNENSATKEAEKDCWPAGSPPVGSAHA